jgi:CRISPR-associated protein Cas2
MTVAVTRNVSDRMRGFLASSMLEVGPGIYTAPRLSAGVRERIWSTVESWWRYEQDASLVLLWADSQATCGQSLRVLGVPPVELVELDGLVVSKRPASGQ